MGGCFSATRWQQSIHRGLKGCWVFPFWEKVARSSVVQLVGADATEILILPAPAPFGVEWPAAEESHIGALLDRLERIVNELLSTWLPEAASIEGRSALALAAIRSLALRHATMTSHHGPYLADLAERSLLGTPTRTVFPQRVRAIEVARLLAECADRSELALVVEVKPDMDSATRDTLLLACERAADLGGFTVWLVGDDIGVAAVRRVAVRAAPPPASGLIVYPPLAGGPHPGSSVEKALERALRIQPWAAPRQWNQTHRFHTLANPVRLDLLWADERLNVEIDGPEHRDPEHYAADRRRDYDLQLAGYAVLRFTNSEIEHDVSAVVTRIERFITGRRTAA